jgi:hypothetical protein
MLSLSQHLILSSKKLSISVIPTCNKQIDSLDCFNKYPKLITHGNSYFKFSLISNYPLFLKQLPDVISFIHEIETYYKTNNLPNFEDLYLNKLTILLNACESYNLFLLKTKNFFGDNKIYNMHSFLFFWNQIDYCSPKRNTTVLEKK